jgi:high-affinity K+ transport system ATPase subunit B
MAEFAFDRTVEVTGVAESIWIADMPRLVSCIGVVHSAREIEPLGKYSAVIQDKVGMFEFNADLSSRFTDVRVSEFDRRESATSRMTLGSSSALSTSVRLR